MMRDAITHCLDEHWPLRGGNAEGARGPIMIIMIIIPQTGGQAASLDHGGADSKDVISIDADGLDAVGDAAGGDAVAAVLLRRRRRDGVAVVAADKNARAGARRCEVQRCVEIALARGALAKVACYDGRGRGGGIGDVAVAVRAEERA